MQQGCGDIGDRQRVFVPARFDARTAGQDDAIRVMVPVGTGRVVTTGSRLRIETKP